MWRFFCLFSLVNAGLIPHFRPVENDYYQIKERILITSDIFGDDYEPIWSYDEKEMKRAPLEEIKPIEQKQNNTANQIDYDYFYDKNATREKKQLVESKYTVMDQTTIAANLTEEYIAGLQNQNGTFNYTEKEDETPSSWLFSSIEPENCTEDVGYGFTALRCIKSTQGSQQAYIILKIVFFWLIFDLAILLLLWCTKGWCCCCCPFQFCKVNKRINETQRFLAYNPPGEWTDEKGNHHEYDPTPEEKIIYEDMSRSFMII